MENSETRITCRHRSITIYRLLRVLPMYLTYIAKERHHRKHSHLYVFVLNTPKRGPPHPKNVLRCLAPHTRTHKTDSIM